MPTTQHEKTAEILPPNGRVDDLADLEPLNFVTIPHMRGEVLIRRSEITVVAPAAENPQESRVILSNGCEFHSTASVTQIKRALSGFILGESGATAIEYGMIAALVAVAAVTAWTALGGELGAIFGNVNNAMQP